MVPRPASRSARMVTSFQTTSTGIAAVAVGHSEQLERRGDVIGSECGLAKVAGPPHLGVEDLEADNVLLARELRGCTFSPAAGKTLRGGGFAPFFANAWPGRIIGGPSISLGCPGWFPAFRIAR